jgi:hypothetical protein
VLGPEGRMTPITRGHFSKLNLVKSFVYEQPSPGKERRSKWNAS